MAQMYPPTPEFPFVRERRFASLYEKMCTGLFYLILMLQPLSQFWIDKETGEGAFLTKFILLFGVLSLPIWKVYYRHWEWPMVFYTIFIAIGGLSDLITVGGFNLQVFLLIRQVFVGIYFSVICYNLIRKDSNHIKYLLFSIMWGAAFSAVAALAGLGVVGHEEGIRVTGERIAVLGQNSNGTARVVSSMIVFALLCAGGLIKLSPLIRCVVYVMSVACAMTMLKVASRGGMAALILTIPFFLLVTKSFNKKLLYVFLSALAVAALVAAVLCSDTLYDRFVNTFLDRDTGGREGLFYASIELWLDSIWRGRGLLMYRMYIAEITGGLPLATHNAYVYPLVSAGILGGFFYFGALWGFVRRAWVVRSIPYGNVTFLLLVVMLWGGLTGTIEVQKHNFILFGLASGIYWQAVGRWQPKRRWL